MNIISNFLKNENFNKNTLVSFFYRIEPINFTLIIDKISYFKKAFTFFNSKEEVNFIALDELKKDFNYNIPLIRISNVDNSILQKFPLLVGYKKFTDVSKTNLWNDFKANYWFIPKFLIAQKENDYFIIHNFYNNDYDEENFNQLINLLSNNFKQNFSELKAKKIENQENESDWEIKINYALRKISTNELEKVVIARKTKLELSDKFSLQTVHNLLLKNCNDCVVFSIKEANSIFFGATPEKLFSFNKNILQTEALAGSIERSKNETEDAFLGNQLLRDPKELNEQKKVLDYILSILSKYADDINFNKIPFIKKLNSVQHLQTKITASINNNFDILKFLNEIHPTPAVCGLPKDDALKFILETENFDRGLYAGVIGWFNNYNVGEFYVGIRSALLKEHIIHLFAGCGIVEGSIPQKEFQETEIKLKPILSLFSL